MAAFTCSLQYEDHQVVVFEELRTSGVRKVILNRPTRLNTLNYDMVSKILTTVGKYEYDPTVSCIVLKGNGRAFSAGGDLVYGICSSISGHWSYLSIFYRKILLSSYLLATFRKPVISLMHGIVMGAGAALAIHTPFRVVTEKTVFAMPEALIGLFPDVGASYFLSRLPGSLGEFMALTGARLDGPEMVACGLATHFVQSKNLQSLERKIYKEISLTSTKSDIDRIIEEFAETPHLREDSVLHSLETVINGCFSKNTVEEILSSLEDEVSKGEKKWIKDAYKSMKSASPTSLKLTLRSIREGRRRRNLEQCLAREFFISCHVFRGTVNRDLYEGTRAILLDKDPKPKWNPPSLEQVTEEMVNKFFEDINDPEISPLRFPHRPTAHIARL